MLCSREKKNLQFKEHPGTSMSQHKSLTEISSSLGCKRKREAGKHRHTFPPLLLLILIYPKCINLLTGKPYKIVTAMEFQRLYGWDVHTPTETIPLRSVKNSIQINLPDVLSHSSGACITKSEDADLTTYQCNHNPKTSAAPPERTYLMPPVISHWQQQVKIKLIPSKNSEMCLTRTMALNTTDFPLKTCSRLMVQLLNAHQVTDKSEWTSHAHTAHRSCKDNFVYSSAYKSISHWQMKLVYFYPFDHFFQF